jgi:cytosine/adenosine deaminase-related metal-dependent hydrolase
MDTADLRRAYESLFAEAAAGGFGRPPAGEWTAEQVVAHVAANDLLLAETTTAVLAGDPKAYYNHDAIDAARLDALVTEHGDLAALVELARGTSGALFALVERLGEQGDIPVHTHIRDGGEVMVDQPVPWGRVLELHASGHLPLHVEQLRSLRADAR